MRDENANDLATWHASKRRESAMVAVAGLDNSATVRLPDLALG